MIIVRLQGGLGNQMFQYATARSLSKEKICFDLSFLAYHHISTDEITARPFELGLFKNLKAKHLNKNLVRLIFAQSKRSKFIKVLLPRPLKKIDHITDQNIHSYHSVPFNKKTYLFQGDFQNPGYFSTFRDELINEFKFPDLPPQLDKLANEIITTNSVCLHVRRGDYLKPILKKFHGVLSLEYYLEAMDKISEKLENPAFYVFSDDMDWCKENLGGLKQNLTLVAGNDLPAWTDMQLMSLCKNNIIANSTFSWWGAWLNQNPDKIVIAPKKWFAQLNDDTDFPLIPDKWIKL